MKNINSAENPEFLNDYIIHLRIVKMLAERTINEYYFDIRLFLKYIHMNNIDSEKEIEDIEISDMTVDEIRDISTADIYNFMFYVSDERKNANRSRARKTAALRGFFRYMTKIAHLIDDNPVKDIDMPSPKMSMPHFLSLNESRKLLETADKSDSLRDYCMITILLNCGVRLSELISINVRDVDFSENLIRIMGKGSKERIIYLNNACISAITDYLKVRNSNPEVKEEPALFISNRNRRISKRRVQQIVEQTIKNAELDGKGYTTHKLRHTSATLMYQYGNADILTLKELLGHSSTATTEIYTHLCDEQVRNAVESNPLADIRKK